MHYRNVLCFTTDTQSRRQGIIWLANKRKWMLDFRSLYDVTEDWHGDGVLMTGTAYSRREGQQLLERLQARRIPVVLLEIDDPRGVLPSVVGDDRAIGRLAADHFATQRFEHAAFFSSETNLEIPEARLDGFRENWKGRTLRSWLWTKVASGKRLQNRTALHDWLVRKLKDSPKPLAVFAWNDFDAGRLLNACLEAGVSIPDEVAILGVDNYLDICEHASVKLSSIKHDLPRIGHVGAAMLDRLMSGRKLARRCIKVKPQGIVTRASTDSLAAYEEELRPILTFIDGNLSHAFGAAEIAAALKIPRSRLDYLFKTKRGHSVGTEIATRRLALAKKLLLTTRLPVEDVSRQCGYCNRSFFSRCFRSSTGTTPLAWRKARSSFTRA